MFTNRSVRFLLVNLGTCTFQLFIQQTPAEHLWPFCSPHEKRVAYLDASDVHNGPDDVVVGGGRVVCLVAVAPVDRGGDLAQEVHGVFQHGCSLQFDVNNVLENYFMRHSTCNDLFVGVLHWIFRPQEGPFHRTPVFVATKLIMQHGGREQRQGGVPQHTRLPRHMRVTLGKVVLVTYLTSISKAPVFTRSNS